MGDIMQLSCRLATRMFATPIAVVTLVEIDRERVAAAVGLDPGGVAEPLQTSLSYYVAQTNAPLAIGNVRGERGDLLAYLGVPLRLGDGERMGALSVMDRVPREWQPADVQAITDLATVLVDHDDVQHALAERDAFAREARQDALTGLGNRRQWLERAPIELARAARQEKPLSIAVVDLDNFKAVNDRQGHAAGDRVLRTLGRRWSPLMREPDLLVRWGGDEFAMLLSDASAAQARMVVGRLLSVTADVARASFGVAEWDRREDADTLLARADACMLRAKRVSRCGTPEAAP